MRKLRFAAGITYFYPDKKCLQRLDQYLDVFDAVYIYDNTDAFLPYAKTLKKNKRIHYITHHTNDGLPKAFNEIMKQCDETFDYLCILDQDSDFSCDNIVKIEAFISKMDSDEIGIIAPKIMYYHDHSKNNKPDAVQDYVATEWVIASGSFVRLKTVKNKKIHFDEAYFIDRFDVDFCKQLDRLGKKVLVFNHAVLFQNLGYCGSNHHSQHASFRHYYIFRNRLYYNHKFYTWPVSIIRTVLQSTKHLFYIMAYENSSFTKIKYCFRGMKDYFMDKMGGVK